MLPLFLKFLRFRLNVALGNDVIDENANDREQLID